MNVVVLVAAAAVDVTKFITSSEASIQAKKTASLLKTLNVSALITGEIGVGKKTLASFILPDVSVYDASNFDELLIALESSNELIISNIDRSPNLQRLVSAIQDNGVRIIATSSQLFSNDIIDELCSIKLELPPLRERDEDIAFLVDLFLEEAYKLFGGNKETFSLKNMNPDLSKNAHSLRRQVMISFLLEDIKDTELMDLIGSYLYDKLGSKNDYKEYLYLYEVPLIKAGINKFKSQLQLSDKLGLNRNTLRKKISDNKQYLEKEI
ncbi:Fis family transcriptional regulator [Sulfurimonas sp.]